MENFREREAVNDFPRISLGRIGGIAWYCRLRKSSNEGRTYFYPVIGATVIDSEISHRIRGFFNVSTWNKSTEKSFKDEFSRILKCGKVANGYKVYLSEIMDEKKGWLDENGTLSIEYGIHVESIQSEDGIWKFNFFDRLIDCKKENNMISFIDKSNPGLFSHKMMLQLHSNFFAVLSPSKKRNQRMNIPNETDNDTLEICLQIAHGVQLEVPHHKIFDLLRTAHAFQFPNVIRYCERQLIENQGPVRNIFREIRISLRFNLRSYLRHLMRESEFSSNLVLVLKRLDIQMMSSESMKICVGYLFDNV